MITHLCFHGIGRCTTEREPGEARYWVSADVFHHILDHVAGRPRVELSFDDGNASDLEIALPALQARGLQATFFILAGRLDDRSSLGPADLRELRRAGMEIGNHGWRHVPWRGLDLTSLQRELVDARSALESVVGRRITQAAAPLGQYDRSVLKHLKAAGYRTVFTSDRFPARRSAWLQARYSVTASDTVDSVRQVLDRPPGWWEARNLAASVVKRFR